MDYGGAIEVFERANEKFEFPVQWGIDLQSEHERYLTEKYAKEPVIVMNYPKAIKAFYMRVNDDGRTVATMEVLARGSARSSPNSLSQRHTSRTRGPHGRAQRGP
jgi:asparaginyl-tRNA synthetase